MPDDETKSKILMYTAKFVKNAGLYALHESYKSIPGGVAVSKIVKDTVKDVQSEILKSEKLKVLDENVKKQLLGSTQIINRAEKDDKGGVGPVSNDGFNADNSPKDVIRVFMMKEFFGTRFFNNVMVHELATKKKEKSRVS